MLHLHQELDAGPDDLVEVAIDNAANVMLVDAANYEQYQRGAAYKYYGGSYDESPARIAPPHPGRWHVVVDLGGRGGRVRARIQVLEGANA